jgi:membrane protease YdiL (CAAX protease family)
MQNGFENREPEHEQRFTPPSPRERRYPLVSPLAAAVLGLASFYILYVFLASIFTALIFGFDISKANTNAIRLMQIAMQILGILLPALYLAHKIYNDVPGILRLRLPSVSEIGIFMLGILILYPLLSSLAIIQDYWVDIIVKKYPLFQQINKVFSELNTMVEDMYVRLMTSHSPLESVLIVMMVVFIPGLTEEAMFRGLIQKSFELRFGSVLAVIITSLFFAMSHMTPASFIGLFILSCYFGYAVIKSNSLIVSIALHCFNNFIALTTMFIFGVSSEGAAVPVSTKTLNASYVASAILLSLFILHTVIIHRFYNNLKNTRAKAFFE